MAGFTDLVKKTFYLGVGAAAYAGEKAGNTLKDLQKAGHNLRQLQEQAQVLVNGLVERGEVTAEEAQKIMNEWGKRYKHGTEADLQQKPQPISIDDQPISPMDPVSGLRQQITNLRQELDNLRQKSRDS